MTGLVQFDAFALNLMKMLEKCFFGCISENAKCRSKYVQREKLWSAFHVLRLGELKKLWQNIFSKSGFPKLSPFVYQQVNQHLFSDLVSCHINDKIDHNPVEIPPLTTDEETIVRYAAGYVPFKLLKKYEMKRSEEAVSVVECLSAMAINGEESNLLDYTRKWIALINRGGLYEINDGAYTFFREVEIKVRKHLITALELKTNDQDVKRTIVDSVAGDESVQFYWTIVSVDIESEDQATSLLKEIIGTWLTMRGHSIAGTWTEQYLHFTKQAKSKKGLRTELKRKDNPPESDK